MRSKSRNTETIQMIILWKTNLKKSQLSLTTMKSEKKIRIARAQVSI